MRLSVSKSISMAKYSVTVITTKVCRRRNKVVLVAQFACVEWTCPVGRMHNRVDCMSNRESIRHSLHYAQRHQRSTLRMLDQSVRRQSARQSNLTADHVSYRAKGFKSSLISRFASFDYFLLFHILSSTLSVSGLHLTRQSGIKQWAQTFGQNENRSWPRWNTAHSTWCSLQLCQLYLALSTLKHSIKMPMSIRWRSLCVRFECKWMHTVLIALVRLVLYHFKWYESWSV